MTTVGDDRLSRAFDEHRGYVWALGYRLTGNAADADDIVQETFTRALDHPALADDRPLRPWLATVAANLGRDLLRRRKRRRYEGEWLPSPIDTDGAQAYAVDPTACPGARYDRLESVSFAFLRALEALTPNRRTVLILRDAFDFSVAETAAALGTSEAAVKQTHRRARLAMESYDRDARPLDASRREQVKTRLEALLAALQDSDIGGLVQLLSDDAGSWSDGGGEFHAARQVVRGPERIARMYVGLAGGATITSLDFRSLNGLPGIVFDVAPKGPGFAPRVALLAEVDTDGRIGHLYNVLATDKLTALA